MVVDSILPHAECGPNDHRKDVPQFTFSKLEKESRKTKKHIRHIIKLGLAFTFIIFFPISGCLQETILKSYEEKTGESINAYLCQAKDIKMHVERRDFSFSHVSSSLKSFLGHTRRGFILDGSKSKDYAAFSI